MCQYNVRLNGRFQSIYLVRPFLMLRIYPRCNKCECAMSWIGVSSSLSVLLLSSAGRHLLLFYLLGCLDTKPLHQSALWPRLQQPFVLSSAVCLCSLTISDSSWCSFARSSSLRLLSRNPSFLTLDRLQRFFAVSFPLQTYSFSALYVRYDSINTSKVSCNPLQRLHKLEALFNLCIN